MKAPPDSSAHRHALRMNPAMASSAYRQRLRVNAHPARAADQRPPGVLFFERLCECDRLGGRAAVAVARNQHRCAERTRRGAILTGVLRARMDALDPMQRVAIGVVQLAAGGREEAGDGLDEDAIWVDERLDPARAASNMQFPNGAIIVKSSGNYGDVMRRRLARIVIPAGGEVVMPIKLEDTRGANPDIIHQLCQCLIQTEHQRDLLVSTRQPI